MRLRKPPPLQSRLIRGRAIGAVSKHVLQGIAPVQEPVQLAAVMHRRVGHRIAPDQLVRPIHVHMVLVAVPADEPRKLILLTES